MAATAEPLTTASAFTIPPEAEYAEWLESAEAVADNEEYREYEAACHAAREEVDYGNDLATDDLSDEAYEELLILAASILVDRGYDLRPPDLERTHSCDPDRRWRTDAKDALADAWETLDLGEPGRVQRAPRISLHIRVLHFRPRRGRAPRLRIVSRRRSRARSPGSSDPDSDSDPEPPSSAAAGIRLSLELNPMSGRTILVSLLDVTDAGDRCEARA